MCDECSERPGFYRYEVEVGEKDGTVWEASVYGVDMTDALNKLLWNRRVHRVENILYGIPDWCLFILWMGVTILPGTLSSVSTNNPVHILYVLGINFLMITGWRVVNKWSGK